ncbi:relaxase/mobilization nuclease domain-containing protein [Iningainema tapete]|uniref:Relaxase/mobilization nuclease domain-containing protein n=1 Tax=Iningainema tapete BLCC-T55 TaxID=2748662 RepID=A0A8J6XF08_9CYAN|nr:relaxase/mobilization nuclease domain-containing protein [Iningainema tapete]MBD2772583.1 relaxase/mobilization nuclease domain-containing protein [Iningainema tapete BLCC-T55]
MIGKQIKGTDFYGCLDYVLGKEGTELIGGNMVGETPAELFQEFQLSVQRHERTRTKKPTRKVVYHATLSVPAEEALFNDTWCAIAENYLQGMGFDDNQYILARHTDTEHNHVHIVASRLRLNGSTVSEWQDYKRSEELIRDLEKKYELTPAPSSFEKERRSPTTGERRLTKRTGEISARKKLQDTIDQLTQDSPTMLDLIGQLKDQGIDVRVSPTPTGEMGISYQLNGIAFSGTHLGKAYTFKGLQKYRGVSYSEKQGQEAIEQALHNSSATQAEEQQQQQALLAHQNEMRKHQEEEEKKSRTETTPDSYPATPNNLDSEQKPESRVNPKQQQQAAKTRHNSRSRLMQQQSVILDDDNISAYGQSTVDENDSKVKREQELFEVTIGTTSAIQQQRRPEDVDGDQSETKLHERESQAADAAPQTPTPVLPDRNENNWQAVQEYLVGDRQLPKQIVELLHVKSWIYADDEGQTVFVERTLDGEPTGALVLNDSKFSSIRLDPDEPAAPNDSNTILTGCFWVATITPIQRAVLTSDPVEVLSVIALDPDFNQTPTLYLAADSVKAIPKEFLEKLPTVVVGLKGDEEGNAVSEEILAALPQARRINPGMAGWNKLLTDEREDIKSEVQKLYKKQTGDQGLDID